MAGYSGKPLASKLGIKKDHRVSLINAPSGFAQTLGELPDGVQLRGTSQERKRPEQENALDMMVYFTKSRDQLVKEIPALAQLLSPAGGLWIAWPKKASGVVTDLTEDKIREIGLEAGLVDNKVCAVDEVWSGLRFVIRVKDRPNRKR
jgi:hypothetical protein